MTENFEDLSFYSLFKVSRRDVDASLKFNCNESGSSIADLTNSLMSDVLGGDSAATKSVGEFVFRVSLRRKKGQSKFCFKLFNAFVYGLLFVCQYFLKNTSLTIFFGLKE